MKFPWFNRRLSPNSIAAGLARGTYCRTNSRRQSAP